MAAMIDRTSDAARLERGPAGVLYWLWTLFWLLMIVISLQDYYRNGGSRWWEPLLWEGSSALVATAWLVLQRHVDRRYAAYLGQPWRWLAAHAKWLPLLAISFVATVYAIRHAVYAAAGVSYNHEPWLSVLVYETIKLVLFLGLWLALIFGLNAFAELQEQRRRLLIVQRSLAEAQLAHLKAQLRPHFFFNVLNTISALMQVDVARADGLLTRLADLLRTTLQWNDREVIALREEVRMLELYAQIMQERFGDRVTLTWHIDAATLDAAVPALLLQPLLENAFKHGVERTRGHVPIVVESRRDQDRLYVAVRNPGSILTEPLGTGVGLRNCRERLHVLFAGSARCELTQTSEGVEARITLPWREYRP